MIQYSCNLNLIPLSNLKILNLSVNQSFNHLPPISSIITTIFLLLDFNQFITVKNKVYYYHDLFSYMMISFQYY